jgi:uncharacterized membrane protein
METFEVTRVSIVFLKINFLHYITTAYGNFGQQGKTMKFRFRQKLTYQNLLQYFLQGVLILAPVAVTAYLIIWLFLKLDNLIPIYIHSANNEKPIYLPGIGFIVVITVVILVGYLSSFFLVNRTLRFFNHWLERAPGIKNIYSVVRDFSEAFAGKKKKFNAPVLISAYNEDVWQIGFITNEDLKMFGLEEHVSVYIPQTYAIAGTMFLVKRERIRLLPDVAAADALKFAISGGVVEVVDEHHGHLK